MISKKSLTSLIAFLIIVLPGHRSALAQDSIIQRIHFALPSIVEITAQNAVAVRGPKSTALDKQTGRLIQIEKIKTAQYTRSGSGVIIDPTGIIATNAHIVSDAKRIAVRMMDGVIVSANPLKVFPDQDLAFLKITPPYPITRIDFADSANVKINEEIVTVGSSPFLKKTISAGRIIGLGKQGRSPDSIHPDLFQININIYHGDSGGPLFNFKGQLVGLMVAGQFKIDRSSFAIPSNKILQLYLKYLQSLEKAQKQL